MQPWGSFSVNTNHPFKTAGQPLHPLIVQTCITSWPLTLFLFFGRKKKNNQRQSMHTWKANTNNHILPRPSSGSHDTRGILHLPQQITNCKIYQNQLLYLLKRMTYSFGVDKGQITDKTKSTWKQNSNKTCPKVTESKYIIWASCPIKTWRKLNRKKKKKLPSVSGWDWLLLGHFSWL